MTLRLAWAGPWNARSAIAAFGTEIVAALTASGHTVEVLRTEVGEAAKLAALPAPGVVRFFDRPTSGRMEHSYDMLMVNFGNHFEFHGAALPGLGGVPTLAILHDATMDDFVYGWRAFVASGEIARDASFERVENGQSSALEWICSRCAGAVVHGRHYQAAVAAACSGPVQVIPLALTFQGICTDLPPPPPVKNRLILATVGHVNANKRVDQVIRAIGASPILRERTHYIVVGPVEDAERGRLTRLAARVGAPAPDFTGWVSDDTLCILLAGTHAICCLRHPVLEGGSASLILALRSGRPTLVSDQGSYSEVPDGLVFKCPPGREAAHVLHHLEGILEDSASAQAVGQKARDYAERVHSPRAYVDALMPLVERAARNAVPMLARRRILDTIAGLGWGCDHPYAARAARGLDDLLGDGGKEIRDATGSERLHGA